MVEVVAGVAGVAAAAGAAATAAPAVPAVRAVVQQLEILLNAIFIFLWKAANEQGQTVANSKLQIINVISILDQTIGLDNKY